MIQIAPSILACDFSKLGCEALEIAKAGGDMLHVDVMDGHFVPNISLGVPVVQSLRKATDLFLDVHLMITDPLRYVEPFAKAGSDLICFHIESECDPAQVLAKIKSFGKKAGIALSPDTPVETLAPYLGDVDLVLVMSVYPGFGGQKFMPSVMPKLDWLVRESKARGVSPWLEVDGGIDATTAAVAASHGANVLVAGSAVFGKADYHKAITEIRQSALSAKGF